MKQQQPRFKYDLFTPRREGHRLPHGHVLNNGKCAVLEIAG